MTYFEYEMRVVTGNGNYMDLLKLTWKIREITSSEFFLA